MKIYPVIAENWKMDGGAIFGVVPQTIWRKFAEPDENNLIKITSRCLLVDEGKKKILFDTGMGHKQSDKYYGYRYLSGHQSIVKAINEAGFAAEDITDVVFTHLHDDHCGGAIILNDNGAPELVFKRAMHWVSKDQWEWANHPNDRESGSYFEINYIPLMNSGKLTLIDNPGKFSETVDLIQMNGHTQGQLIPRIRLNDKNFVFTADFIPSSAHIQLPFIASVDIQPLIALQEKEAFLNEAVDKNYYLIFEHEFATECCSLQRTEKGIRMEKAFSLNEILY